MDNPQLAGATHWNHRCTGDDSFPGSAWERIAVEAPANASVDGSHSPIVAYADILSIDLGS